jgi:hypothetical protein
MMMGNNDNQLNNRKALDKCQTPLLVATTFVDGDCVGYCVCVYESCRDR